MALCTLRLYLHVLKEIFTILTEAKILIEQWRQEYNQVRSHSALGYRPPAPEATMPKILT